MLLHEFGSNHPVGVYFRPDGFSMAPFYIVKDLYGINFMFVFLSYLVFLVPNLLGHPDNYILSNPLVTPTHIVPEWYFLPLYAILRSVPDKLLGIIILAFAFAFLLFLPFIFGVFNLVRSFYYKPFMKLLVLIFVVNSFFFRLSRWYASYRTIFYNWSIYNSDVFFDINFNGFQWFI
jgi:ubiquinol-cytochrome c reductase cytochrome b subunit